MAYESGVFQEIIRRVRNMSLFFPFMSRLYDLSIRRNSDNEESDQESSSNEDSSRQRIILVNPSARHFIVMHGISNLAVLFREHGDTVHDGRLPASTKSIEAMKKVEIVEGDDGECVVCLEQFKVDGVVKEMPCQHRFHGNCIEKWLRIHGSCPVCRYHMPIDDKEE